LDPNNDPVNDLASYIGPGRVVDQYDFKVFGHLGNSRSRAVLPGSCTWDYKQGVFCESAERLLLSSRTNKTDRIDTGMG
jgi:hypothetical protein